MKNIIIKILMAILFMQIISGTISTFFIIFNPETSIKLYNLQYIIGLFLGIYLYFKNIININLKNLYFSLFIIILNLSIAFFSSIINIFIISKKFYEKEINKEIGNIDFLKELYNSFTINEILINRFSIFIISIIIALITLFILTLKKNKNNETSNKSICEK